MFQDWDELQDWVKSKAWLLAATLIFSVWGVHAWLTRPLNPPPGVLVPEDPIQGAPTTSAAWTYRDHNLISLASFDLRARVLGKERYRFDRAAELSPIDLAMGWGRMSDSAVLESIKIRQEDRWYFWSPTQSTIAAEEITSHSANMHMIPSSPWVQRQLLALRVGQVVHLRGQLIQADGRDQWHWRSSLSRSDSGEGACEVIWVETVEPR